ncbi:helix-turn-helix transcriptional regulator [Pseudoalteromonas fenneropenaei]|uniref:Helix-turn-helix transcriptional regulator n=1 Tax=Pseudoalteromonas fenneropenaei TaxID=1737459 RepID=A0ABV7CDX8_9GAMM
MIALNGIEIFDLFFRFAAVGQLGLVLLWTVSHGTLAKRFSAALFILCIASYLLLTAPIEDEHYGWLRQLLLLFTDLTAIAIWLFAQSQLSLGKPISRLNRGFAWLLGGWSLVMLWLFLVNQGSGLLHDLNHWLSFVLLLFVVFRCVLGFQDDLDDRRRKFRLLLVIGSGVYMAMLTFIELAFKFVKDDALFSLLNSGTILGLVTLTGWQVWRKSQPQRELVKAPAVQQHTQTTAQADPRLTAVLQLMDEQFYRQSNLSIAVLADALHIPEHQLRQLINQQLGFSNFSHFLNSYRIPAICQQLQDPAKAHLPILTMALDMGYGSIAAFNRAFKQQMGMTPSEYREQF